MSYKSYKAGMEHRRALARAELDHMNQLRAEAHIPPRDIDQELDRQEPLLAQNVYLAKRADHQAFVRFRRQHLAIVDAALTRPPNARHDADDWERQRADGYRRVFLEHQIQQAWLAKTQADSSPTNPGQGDC